MVETDAPKKRRLNPFAFPSETNARFTLLVVATLMWAFDFGLNVGLSQDTGLVEVPEMGQDLTQTIKLVAIPGILVLAVFALATIIYLFHPNRIRRKKNLRLMNRSDDPRFIDAVQDLVKLSTVSPAPRIEMAAGSRSVDGQAFGFRNHYALRLGGRLRLLFRQNADRFRATVLHELAHIANNDIMRAYFAQAIWIAVVVLVVIPGIAIIAFKFMSGFGELIAGGPNSGRSTRLFTIVLPTIFILLSQFGATLAIFLAIRSSLLRIREVYADWRAAQWGAETSLADILRHNISEDKTSRWTRLWRFHPTSQERLDSLQKPERLFRVTHELPFFVGVLLAYVLNAAIYLGGGLVFILVAAAMSILELLATQFQNPLFVFVIILALEAAILITALILGFWVVYLVAGALGLEIQREAIAETIIGRRSWVTYLRLWKPAAVFSIGFQLGVLLTTDSILPLLPELINSDGLIVLLTVLFLTVSMTCLIWSWLVYVRFFARRILGAHVGFSSPKGKQRLLILVSSGLLLVLYVPVILGNLIVTDIAGQAVGLEISNLEVYVNALPLSIIVALFIYVITFGVTWLLMKAYRMIRKLRCPSCKQVTKKQYVVGQVCEHCGEELAPWLFVNGLPGS